MQEMGMDQRQFAAFLRVTEGAVSRWLSGGNPVPGTVVALVEMALAQRTQEAR